MFAHLYVRRGTVYMPTVALSESGLYLDIEPVEVVSASDPAAVQAAVERTLARGQPRIPALKPPFPPPVVLKHARVRSWGAFERGASTLGIDDKGGRYRIIPYRVLRQGGWEEDIERAEVLPPEASPSDVGRRVAGIVRP